MSGQDEHNLRTIVDDMRSKAIVSVRAIADELNAQGHTTRRGRPWNPVQVARVLERAEAGSGITGRRLKMADRWGRT